MSISFSSCLELKKRENFIKISRFFYYMVRIFLLSNSLVSCFSAIVSGYQLVLLLFWQISFSPPFYVYQSLFFYKIRTSPVRRRLSHCCFASCVNRLPLVLIFIFNSLFEPILVYHYTGLRSTLIK